MTVSWCERCRSLRQLTKRNDADDVPLLLTDTDSRGKTITLLCNGIKTSLFMLYNIFSVPLTDQLNPMCHCRQIPIT